MSDDRNVRVAALVIISDAVDVEALTAAVGVPPDRSLGKGKVRPGSTLPFPAKEHSWEIRESGRRSVAISEVIERLLCRAIPLRNAIMGVKKSGCEVKLKIIQWISDDDPHGPGFSLDGNALKFLADVGAFVDVDQYLE
ncbi:DUF4279 domain-containing protein [Salinispora sp. H7-4]|nr:DUF4279 domain-containing protein [Salinispora sp. H7-4]